MIVWLWDTSGPARCGRGVTDDRARALQIAETYLRGGLASVAQVEGARLVPGTHTLSTGYERPGKGGGAAARTAASAGSHSPPPLDRRRHEPPASRTGGRRLARRHGPVHRRCDQFRVGVVGVRPAVFSRAACPFGRYMTPKAPSHRQDRNA